MRVVVNDYSGHPFQVQLSRALAARGHDVLHLYFADFQTPKGDLQRRDDDPERFAVHGLSLGQAFAKHAYARRLFQERAYGRLAARAALAHAPDVVIGCNNPLDAQQILFRAARQAGIPFVYWLQDLYSLAIEKLLRLPLAGSLVVARYRALERSLLRGSDGVIAATEDFLPVLASWGVGSPHCLVQHNWAPLDGIMPALREIAWRSELGLAGKKVVLYSGTLGLKHAPMLLVRVAQRLRHRADIAIVVMSEGPGAETIAWAKATQSLTNLTVLPFSAWPGYAQALAGADVLLAMLTAEAGSFSVPSKVLSYLCAGRAIVLAAPANNLSVRIVEASGAGGVAGPDDLDALVARLLQYLDDPIASDAAGRRGRSYAERAFAIGPIADRFEAELNRVVAQRGSSRRAS